MQALAEDVDTLIAADRTARDAAGTSYTPVITGSTSGTATLSTSTINAFYLRRGRMVKVMGTITLAGTPSITGSTSGSLLFSLPVAAKSGYTMPGQNIGTGGVFDASPVARYIGNAYLETTTKFFIVNAATGSTIQNNTPITVLAVGDILSWSVEYEAASAP
jgi:hypothetical protein